MTDEEVYEVMAQFDRRSWLIGLMQRHFPQLRTEQILDYTPQDMEKLLTDKGVNLS